jgi:hypothetical protein
VRYLGIRFYQAVAQWADEMVGHFHQLPSVDHPLIRKVSEIFGIAEG